MNEELYREQIGLARRAMIECAAKLECIADVLVDQEARSNLLRNRATMLRDWAYYERFFMEIGIDLPRREPS